MHGTIVDEKVEKESYEESDGRFCGGGAIRYTSEREAVSCVRDLMTSTTSARWMILMICVIRMLRDDSCGMCAQVQGAKCLHQCVSWYCLGLRL